MACIVQGAHGGVRSPIPGRDSYHGERPAWNGPRCGRQGRQRSPPGRARILMPQGIGDIRFQDGASTRGNGPHSASPDAASRTASTRHQDERTSRCRWAYKKSASRAGFLPGETACIERAHMRPLQPPAIVTRASTDPEAVAHPRKTVFRTGFLTGATARIE